MPLRGVNLGGWLVLEKWMTPSLFRGLCAADETTWCVELGRGASERLRAHWSHFITRADFAWLADVGIDVVRIPLGHWILGAPYPYHAAYGATREPFVAGGIDVLDSAMEWAREAGLKVVLDLHAAPGCQNGFDNGGIQGVCDWHTREEYVDHSVDVLQRLARRYRGHAALHAIELLNEPRWDISTDRLVRYYARAHDAIRQHCPAREVAVVIHDGFRSHREYADALHVPRFENLLFDVHRYQCFEPADLELDVVGHVQKAAVTWARQLDAIGSELSMPVIVGEWSLGLDMRAVAPMAPPAARDVLSAFDGFQRDVACRAYGAAQLIAFEQSAGWFFWSYRTETTPEWCFRECVERGWLPSRFH